MDHGIGEVLAKLDELGMLENTLVVFTSDNGGLTYSRNDPMRDFKATIWEGGPRVPCLVRWPGVIAAGGVSKEAAMTMQRSDYWLDWIPIRRVRMESISCPG